MSEEKKAPPAGRRGRSATVGLGRGNSPMMNEIMEERKTQLFDRQAQEFSEW